jgi:hypothetical protein
MELASRFKLDILSLSYVVEASDHTSITCIAVCALNEFMSWQIGEALEAENHQNNANLYCFLDVGNKLSVRVSEISYNLENSH